jgi:hypothetical protein
LCLPQREPRSFTCAFGIRAANLVTAKGPLPEPHDDDGTGTVRLWVGSWFAVGR